MGRVSVVKTTKYESGMMVEFEKNHNVKAIRVIFESDFCGCLVVQHAQNNILSDLIRFGEYEFDGGTEFEISVPTPVSASHILIFPKESDVKIKEICVYDQDETEFTKCYPLYKDLELSENYYLDTISVFMPADGYHHYSIYTSLDEKNFELLTRKHNNKACDPNTGDVYNAGGREARIIRVYIEYNSNSVEAELKDIKFSGRKSGTPIKEYEPIDIPDFKNSKYNTDITEKDTYDEVYGIIKRRLGKKYCEWFELELADNPREGHTYDYFELTNNEDKIHIKGNNGVSLATGLNYYLKYFCDVNISQVGDQVDMPQKPVIMAEMVFKETKAKVRYAYNYCTLSYSMAFWGDKEWQDELDWLALNGVNTVLDTTAQEEVWRRFLSDIGYTHKEIKKYIAGPAYYAWAYMSNLYGYGGPVHDNWFEKRTELARKNHFFMRKIGMKPVLQGYSGMIPPDITNHDENAEIIPQGTWCSFTRPYMLDTTSGSFSEYADRFYKAQKEVYGDYSNFFATDPFHEGGITDGLSLRDISKQVLGSMLKSNKDAVWIIQSWMQNPSSELLGGIEEIENGKDHALVLDLYAEKLPNYDKGCKGNESYGYEPEFNKTPWIFCMLNNFGGRLGLHGHLDNLANWIPKAFNTCDKIAGIGITPEASVNNPVLYDFFFECIWQDDAFENLEEKNLAEWLNKYCTRRYGAESASAKKAWEIFADTVYKADKNGLGQGAPESVLNARPALEVESASTWGNAIISYDKSELERAARLFITDYDILKHSRGYIYDLITVVQQVLSNRAQDCHYEMVKCFANGNITGFKEHSQKFLNIADDMESILKCSEYYMLGRWVEQAKTLAEGDDDFTKNLYEFNAKSLITTWGPYNQSETGQLHDYSNRQWSGLIGDFYKKRWERFIKNCEAQLKGEPYEEHINWFEWEWNWVRQNTVYPTTPDKIDISVIKNILD